MAATYDIVAALADGLAECGLAHACISPGSRSTPLALTFARHPGIRHWVHHDERSAAFFALGIGRATGIPAAVITTSGTAAAELYPAVIEARFGRVPLLLLTADRPPALRGTGANQTIDQVNLYGSNAKLFTEIPLAADMGVDDVAGYVDTAWETALTPPVGPVHLNLPFDEPLTPPEAFPVFRPQTTSAAHRPRAAAGDPDLAVLTDLLDEPRGIVIAGPLTDGTLIEPVAALAGAAGWPILADPLSGLRTGTHDRSCVVGHGDALAEAGWLDHAAPRAAVRFGPLPVSKALNTWLAAHPEVPYAIVDSTGWADPGGTARAVITADPGATAGAVAARISRPASSDWLDEWRAADTTAAGALASNREFSELAAVDTVLRSVPEPATVWIASSMPIRQVDLMLGVSDRRLRLLGNRGASGIDGFVSSALGSATANGERTVAVTGDLSLLYDLTALGWAGRNGADLTLVVINNDGGGIFSLLPQAPLPEFEELFATPHGLDFEGAAGWFGVDYIRARNAAELADAVAGSGPGPRLIEAQFDREAGAAAFRAAVAAVRQALERASTTSN